MNKPQGFDDIQLGVALTPGGHKCVIKRVEETQSQSGKDMLVIYFDTSAEDTQPGFFSTQFANAQKNPKKDPVWRGKSYLVTEGEYGPANLKRFTTAVEDSNEGFQVAWGNAFASCFKEKKVGIIFRMEEYTTDTGEIRASVKPFRFCNYSKAFEQDVPARKNLPAQEQKPTLQDAYNQAMAQQSQQPHQQTFDEMAKEGFMAIPDDLNDEGLPFNY